MKKLILLLVLPLMVLVFNSCNKDDDGGNSTRTTKLVKQIVWLDEEGTSYSFEYDNKGRITKMIYVEQGDNPYILTYEYNTNSIIAKEGNNIVITYTLNSEGYVIQEEESYSSDRYITQYSYSNGYLSKTTEQYYYNGNPSSTNVTNYTWENGNMIKEESGEYHIIHYTYTDKENKMNINIYDMGDYIRFKGMTSKNYIESERSNDQQKLYYSYVFDEDGYLREFEGADSYIYY